MSAARRSLPSIVIAGAALLTALASLALSAPARADAPLRPWDAPRLGADARGVPALPPEYLTQDAGWIRFGYHPSARDRIQPLLASANELRADLAALFGRQVLDGVEVRVAAVPAEMARLAPAAVPGYAPAVAVAPLGLVVMSLSSPLSLEPPDLAALFRHQLAHVALDRALAGDDAGAAGAAGGAGAAGKSADVPRWFHEGFATWLGDGGAAERARVLTTAALGRRLLPIAALESSLPHEAPEGSIAHAQGADFVGWLARAERTALFRKAIDGVRDGAELEVAVGEAFGEPLDVLERRWREDVARRYAFLPVLGGALLLVLLVGAGILARRAARRRAERALAARRSRREARREAAEVRVLTVRAVRPRDRSRMPMAPPPEAEVPKIEHGGRWHTLH